jgi:hypothetical protein
MAQGRDVPPFGQKNQETRIALHMLSTKNLINLINLGIL